MLFKIEWVSRKKFMFLPFMRMCERAIKGHLCASIMYQKYGKILYPYEANDVQSWVSIQIKVHILAFYTDVWTTHKGPSTRQFNVTKIWQDFVPLWSKCCSRLSEYSDKSRNLASIWHIVMKCARPFNGPFTSPYERRKLVHFSGNSSTSNSIFFI